MGSDPVQDEAAALRAYELRLAMAEMEVSGFRTEMPFANRLVNPDGEPLTLGQFRERVAEARRDLDSAHTRTSAPEPERSIEREI